MRKLIVFLISVCLLSLSLGCGKRIVTKTKVIKVRPPESLTTRQEIPKRPVLSDNLTVGGMVDYYESYINLLQTSIKECNADKKSIREW